MIHFSASPLRFIFNHLTRAKSFDGTIETKTKPLVKGSVIVEANGRKIYLNRILKNLHQIVLGFDFALDRDNLFTDETKPIFKSPPDIKLTCNEAHCQPILTKVNQNSFDVLLFFVAEGGLTVEIWDFATKLEFRVTGKLTPQGYKETFIAIFYRALVVLLSVWFMWWLYGVLTYSWWPLIKSQISGQHLLFVITSVSVLINVFVIGLNFSLTRLVKKKAQIRKLNMSRNRN